MMIKTWWVTHRSTRTGCLHDTCLHKVAFESEHPPISFGRACAKGPDDRNMPTAIANSTTERGSGLVKFCRGILIMCSHSKRSCANIYRCHACCELPFGTFPVAWLELERYLSLFSSRTGQIRTHRHRPHFPVDQATAAFPITPFPTVEVGSVAAMEIGLVRLWVG